MTVQKLIEALQQFPFDAPVYLSSDPEGNSYWEIDEVNTKDTGDGPLVIWPDSEVEL